jgi:hypothetical protein
LAHASRSAERRSSRRRKRLAFISGRRDRQSGSNSTDEATEVEEMVDSEANRILDEIDQDNFIPNARRMIFLSFAAQILVDNLRKFDVEDVNMRSALLALWSLPYYALLYEARCIENGADSQKYRDIVVEINNAVEEKIKHIAKYCA